MKSNRHGSTNESGGSHRRPRRGAPGKPAAWPGDEDTPGPGRPGRSADAEAGRLAGLAGAAAYPQKPGFAGPDGSPAPARPAGPERLEGAARAGRDGADAGAFLFGTEPVARRTATGWRVGDEEVSDLTSAMVLADLLAADLPTEAMPVVPPTVDSAGPGLEEITDPRRLQETVAQLNHALTARVRVEQAIGVLAERHRLRPRQAFELLRSVARARGRRVLEMATEVVDSATNPLLRLPEELAKPSAARRRGRVPRHTLGNG